MQTPPSCADVLIAISLIDSLQLFDTDSLQEEKEKHQICLSQEIFLKIFRRRKETSAVESLDLKIISG